MDIAFIWFDSDVFSRRYIKSLELLHDCDETEGTDSQPRHSLAPCLFRKSSQIDVNIPENSRRTDETKTS